ncbi:potassium channel protein [Nitrospinae bacterium AH_259_B05_G02_I21]|nr:potassium channel protein [Nitrospinae bacterium AH_259_B05_G02_I21]
MRLKVLIVLGVLGTVIASGTVGYHFLEGWPWLDAFYMTLITITTVGFGEVHPLSGSGRLFTVALLVTGVGTVLYGVTTLGETMVEATMGRILRRSRVEIVESIKGHVIVCGYGRLGRYLARHLKGEEMPFVIIERDASRAAAAVGEDYIAVEGDATDEEVLMKAGLLRARAVIAATGSDADNLFVTLSARDLNPQCTVVARAEDPGSEKKLERAGAHKVVSPLRMGSLWMSQAVVRPAILDFLELATEAPELDLVMEGVTVEEGSRLVRQTLGTSGIGRELGLIIIAIRRASNQMLFNPTAETIIEVDDTLITMGEAERVGRLRDLSSAPS